MAQLYTLFGVVPGRTVILADGTTAVANSTGNIVNVDQKNIAGLLNSGWTICGAGYQTPITPWP
jgi:hypothetical protein